MPAKSAKQWGMMQAAAHGRMRGIGPSPEVAKEFISKTPKAKRSSFAKVLGRKRGTK